MKKIIVLSLLMLVLLLLPFDGLTGLFSQQTTEKNQTKTLEKPLTDGPYIVRETNGDLTVYYIHNNQPIASKVKAKGDAVKINIRPLKKTFTIPTAPAPIPPCRLTGIHKMFIVSDIHGQFDRFKSLLINNKVVNKKMQWRFGKGHLVVVGDVMDRGPEVTETLWAIHQLELQAPKKGGRVHMLLGNHETMVLLQDLRYVHAKYTRVADLLTGGSVPALYSPDTVLGQWLRTKPTMLRINRFLFVHGGVHPDIITRNMSMETLNTTVRNNLDTPWETIKADELLNFLFRGSGPFWHRGYFPDDGRPPQVTTAQVRAILDYFQADRIIVGHTTINEITSLHDNLVLAVDAGIKYGDKGEALLWRKGKFHRAFTKGKPKRLD